MKVKVSRLKVRIGRVGWVTEVNRASVRLMV